MELSTLERIYNKNKKPGTIRLIAVYGSFFIIIAALSITAFHFNRKQMHYGIRINLAGRQRMLTQKITKDLLLYRYNISTVKQIISSMDIFESTLTALTYGGETIVNSQTNEFGTLPMTNNPDIKTRLVHTITAWQEYRMHVEKFLDSRSPDALKYVLSNNELLLERVNQVAYQLQFESERNSMIIRILVFTTVLIIIGFISFNLLLSIRKLNKARSELEELEKLLPICSNCKKIREDDSDPEDPSSWVQVEQYLATHKDISFSHGLCPDCVGKLYPEIANRLKKK
ncbi:MAG: type IV pili methyl-accepting chemotaxis transducer N-terminal domain-containing protein [Spirochaetota bacterium]